MPTACTSGSRTFRTVQARRLLGPARIIGVSVGNEAEAREAASWDVDYVGVGPVLSDGDQT